MIDLAKFCDESSRYYGSPFTIGDKTYATNGHIAVVVDRQDGVAELTDLERAERIVKALTRPADARCEPFRPLDLPPPPEVRSKPCDACDGRGTEHDCPDCDCTCEVCNGSGRILVASPRSIRVNGGLFNVEYIRLIQGLPGICLPEDCREPDGIPFSFEGGYGLLMQLRRPYADHIEPKQAGEIEA